MPVPEGTPAPPTSIQTDFQPLTFPPPPAKPGPVVLNLFILYETRTRFFIVGTNAPAATRFRVLKIDRTTALDELSITEDEAVYTKSEVDDLLEMIANGNKSTGGIREIATFYGIVGFVRFTEGYYITIITKRSPVALLGGHYVFHVDGTSTIPIHASATPISKLDKNSDEARYLQMFRMVDLTKNFYFSYSYDITRTLQWNMTRNPRIEGRNQMFVWNQYLLENGFGEQTGIENQWALPVMYGFVEQSIIKWHFLALDFKGYVANDVETEQIVSEMSTTSFYGAGSQMANPRHTSFVQHRGSIPLYWTQDGTNMSPKPPIELNVIDPYFTAAAMHFDDMFKRYGAPCIVLNLIKAKEKTPRESLLLQEFTECIEYLNQFLPEEKKIWHIRWDIRNENVISVLEIIAEKAFARTGFFYSGYNQAPTSRQAKNIIYGSGLQNGVVRTNCIDCLDRTNAAQFIIAKCALGHQLYSLGLIAEPVVPFDCDAVNMLTEMYHEHGDTIALQYGGSHLVNTMETYRKINQWTSQSRDMFESIKRFYSNSFVDAEKQDAMNLFLGNYRARKGVGPALWELPSDYHLHNIIDPELKKVRKGYTRWWTPEALLPQDVIARGSFLYAKEHDLDRFQLHDAGYDGLEEPFLDGFDEEGSVAEQPLNHSDDDSADMDGTRAEKPNSTEKSSPSELTDTGHNEKLVSEDTDEISPISRAIRKADRMDSMDSIASVEDSTQPHDDSIMGTSSLNPSTSSSSPPPDNGPHNGEAGESKVGADSSLEGGLPESKERVEALTNGPEDSSRSSVMLMSSSSSVSSMHQYFQQNKLRTSTSRSSLDAPSLGGSSSHTVQPKTSMPFLSRGEQYAHDGLHGCDDDDAAPGEGGPRSAVWEEYWEEYYRPKVRTSFKTLFAYEMHSTSRYVPPNKSTSEQSPFEVRQNNGLPSQAEIKRRPGLLTCVGLNDSAKMAAKSEKSSMLSWLGLAGSSKSSNSNTSKSVGSGYADGSKTMPLSAGRKKAFLPNLDDDPAFQEKSVNGSGTKDELHRGRSINSAFSPGRGSDVDEKAALRAQESDRDAKVRLPAHVPRSKEEEWELTKNVWSNIPSYAIHEPTFVPGTAATGSDDKHVETSSHDKVTNGSETTKDGHGTTIVSPDSGGANNSGNNHHNSKSRTHLEDTVKRSLHPKVTTHEFDEYERYTRQFKSIRFDSASTKGATAYGNYIHTTPRDEWSISGTGPNTTTAASGSVPHGLSSMHHHHPHHNTDKSPSASESSSSTVRPSLLDIRRAQKGGSSTSTATLGTTYLEEEEEGDLFYSPVSRTGSDGVAGRNGMRGHNSTSSISSTIMGHFNGYGTSGASILSPVSPMTTSVLPLPETATATSNNRTAAIASTGRRQSHPTVPGSGIDTTRTDGDDSASLTGDFLPEPPILAPIQAIIKPPSESEMVLYNAHVELPKLTLYTVGQTSLDPYWGASSGTKARYEAYKMWIHKGRYGHMTMPTMADHGHTGSHVTSAGGGGGGGGGGSGAANANGTGHAHAQGHGAGHIGGKGSKTTENAAVFTGVHNGSGSHNHHQHPQPPPPLRRGSSAIYPTVY
ncbi:phosphatidylinositol-3,5-bisphosphate 5-phosphatase [Mortierella sp. GBA43]|nr:phosphatidylinositol-3,5-bisphosphate 5-phosphatase [Mortierella sp. GBA43]